MKLQVQSLKFDADQKLIDFISRKMDKLETIYERIIDGEAILKLNNEGIDNKTVEIKLNLPKGQIFAKEDAKTFEEATDKATEALRRQIKKYKEKQKVH